MKAQFWSFDIIFAMVIFVFTVLILSYVWYNISNQISSASGFGITSIQTQLQSLNTRILNPGTPVNWESQINTTNTITWNNVSVGLGTGQTNVISYPKIAALEGMSNYNYQSTKAVLGIGYDYYIIISNQNLNITIGKNPQEGNAMSIQIATKNVFINGVPANMRIELWTNTTFGIG